MTGASPAHLAFREGQPIVMPGTNGIGFAQEVRARPDPPAILFMSGYTKEGEGIPAGTRLLRKPFTAEQLLAGIARAMRGRTTREAIGTQARGRTPKDRGPSAGCP